MIIIDVLLALGFGVAGLVSLTSYFMRAGTYVQPGEGGTWLIGAVFSFIALIAGINAVSLIRKARRNYDWYRRQHPEHVDRNGNACCSNCRGKKIAVRNLMRHTYTRAHVCQRCGTTLYYSAE
ncbi:MULTISPECIES: hypothetical protein [Pseudomonadota]|uniref:hypothetical protein n=1 Tax=Pseudomonadota TaxID=1224 RepID=UPI001CA6DDDA|nr:MULTISPECIES: hypothetical protein [Pseudomonadota]MBY8964721.1 hypothetical protein [Algiphilus acroporae]MCI5070709.1 hypothetical protein [Acidovorax sp.]MCI5103542.1 hypothetical protein [Algiphilus sp.]